MEETKRVCASGQHLNAAYVRLSDPTAFDCVEVVNAFRKKGLIYESCENQRPNKKNTTMLSSLGSMNMALPSRTQGGLYTQGKSFRGNVVGCDPRYSFHWTGTGSKLYVFEAPIDMLAFITLYPDGWQSNSYVALCGTAEHAMLWMLEQNQQLEKSDSLPGP